MSDPLHTQVVTQEEFRRTHVMLDEETCEYCKEPVRMMVQKGTGFCSQQCARWARDMADTIKEINDAS